MSKIVLFPGFRPGGRVAYHATARFGRTNRQLPLPLKHGEPTLDQRIEAAGKMCAWHEEHLKAATTRQEQERQRRGVQFWTQRVLDLTAERARATAQPELLHEG